MWHCGGGSKWVPTGMWEEFGTLTINYAFEESYCKGESRNGVLAIGQSMIKRRLFCFYNGRNNCMPMWWISRDPVDGADERGELVRGVGI